MAVAALNFYALNAPRQLITLSLPASSHDPLYAFKTPQSPCLSPTRTHRIDVFRREQMCQPDS